MATDKYSHYFNPGMDPHDGLDSIMWYSGDEVEMWMFEDERTRGGLSPSLDPVFGLIKSPQTYAVWLMDQEGNLQTLHLEPIHHSHIALPKHFSAEKKISNISEGSLDCT
jgi:hypothetical protein